MNSVPVNTNRKKEGFNKTLALLAVVVIAAVALFFTCTVQVPTGNTAIITLRHPGLLQRYSAGGYHRLHQLRHQ